MIKDFLILNCIGKNDKIGFRINNKFYVHDLDHQIQKDQLVLNILNLIEKYKVNMNERFAILVNIGPGSFFHKNFFGYSQRNKNIKKINILCYKNVDLGQFSRANIEFLIEKNY